MIQARCYGVWGAHHYYRTESGHTFSINNTTGGKVVFYHGNVMHGDADVMKLLDETEKAELFKRVEFID